MNITIIDPDTLKPRKVTREWDAVDQEAQDQGRAAGTLARAAWHTKGVGKRTLKAKMQYRAQQVDSARVRERRYGKGYIDVAAA